MTQFEMAEKLSNKMSVSMEEATAALEASGWELLDAALLLERERGAQQTAYTTEKSAEAEQPVEPARPVSRGRSILRGIGRVLRRLFALGNRNRLEIRRDGETLLDVPVTVLVVLLLFAFWPTLILLVIGLFFGLRYAFSGAELGRESVNHAMEKAAEVAERVKDEITDKR